MQFDLVKTRRAFIYKSSVVAACAGMPSVLLTAGTKNNSLLSQDSLCDLRESWFFSKKQIAFKGKILDKDLQPISGREIKVWHADEKGNRNKSRFHGSLLSSPSGEYTIKTVVPGKNPDTEEFKNSKVFLEIKGANGKHESIVLYTSPHNVFIDGEEYAKRLNFVSNPSLPFLRKTERVMEVEFDILIEG